MVEIQIVFLAILLVFSGISSAAETAFVSVSAVNVRSFLKQKRVGAEALYRLKQKQHRTLIAILIANNIINIGAASLATLIFTNIFGSVGVGIATGTITFFVLVFGEIIPKTFATQHAAWLALLMARPIIFLSQFLLPLVIFFEFLSHLVLWTIGDASRVSMSKDDLKTAVTMGVEQGVINKELAEMIHNVLEFKGTLVTKVMTPYARVKMIPGSLALNDVLELVTKTPYSRYPVYIGKENNITGILDVDDVLECIREHKLRTKVKNIANKPFFVPSTKEIDDLLFEFEAKHTHMAIVVDEYGNVDGVITVHDILDEIIGDILDKSKRESLYIHKLNDRVTEVDARATIEEINEMLHLGLKSGHFGTIAGFITHKLQKIPKKGERVELKNAIIEVEKVSQRRIEKVKILRK